MNRMSALVLFVAAFLSGILLRPAESVAQNMSFIRDAEIENIIRIFATPVFRAAGLTPSSVHIYLVKDRDLNAFVAGGQNLFLNTGLLMRAEHAGQVIGVIAHETGHIAGGHLSRMHDSADNAGTQSIVGMVLGAAAAVATGQPQLGTAIMSGGQQLALSNLLRFSQTQEYSADLAATKFLDTAGESAKGLVEFLEVLGDQEALYTSNQDPYVRTHPLSRDRLDSLRQMVAKSRFTNQPVPPDLNELHRRMQAKLVGFIDPLPTVLKRYPESDKSLEGRYARAIAYYKRPDLATALPLVDGLIAERPEDPYFLELKGQIMFENGRLAEALQPYEKAVQLLPHSALLRVSLAQVQIELNAANNDAALLDPAILNLRMALASEANAAFPWRLLATAYGRKGDMGMSSIAMAEEAIILGKKKDARFFAERADKLLPKDSAGHVQAQDILRATDEDKDKRRQNP